MPKKKTKKFSPKQKQCYREVIDGIIANGLDRAREKAEFLGEMQPLINELNGTQKFWLFNELGKFKCGVIKD